MKHVRRFRMCWFIHDGMPIHYLERGRGEPLTLVIAAENDFTPLAAKRAFAAALGAEFVLVRGSRHGTPFDAVGVVTAALV